MGALAQGSFVITPAGRSGIGPGDPVALVLVPAAAAPAERATGGVALAHAEHAWFVPGEPATLVAEMEAAIAPRWVWWSAATTAAPLVAAGLRLSTCWDLAAVSRVLHGGADDDPAHVWAAVNGLGEDGLPRSGQLDLLGMSADAPPADDGDPEEPIGPDGYLRPEWVASHWVASLRGAALRGAALRGVATAARATRWAALALRTQRLQQEALLAVPDRRRDRTPPHLPVATARSESAGELLAVELAHEGLPLDVAVAATVLDGLIGPRPTDQRSEQEQRARRDASVLRHAGAHGPVDPRSAAAVRGLLAAHGIDVPDTRSWRLEPYRATSPLVDALLTWRRADRFATTYGYGWIDRNVGPDGRLRGTWSGSDGAGGRMTAQAGLHNMPAELRPAVRAEPGSLLVRADLGQIEPRVLAAVSGDEALAGATSADDLYLPVAARLGCDRPTAKVAVLAAMYGQTSGTAGEALRGLDRAYPGAMRYLRRADEQGRAGRDVRTHGGRLVRVGRPDSGDARSIAARGRFARNAVVQGAAAELFKAWAATVRAGLRNRGGALVLCLHDELLLHVPAAQAEGAARLLHEALDASAGRWAAGSGVRFVADVSILERWSDAKS